MSIASRNRLSSEMIRLISTDPLHVFRSSHHLTEYVLSMPADLWLSSMIDVLTGRPLDVIELRFEPMDMTVATVVTDHRRIKDPQDLEAMIMEDRLMCCTAVYAEILTQPGCLAMIVVVRDEAPSIDRPDYDPENSDD